MQWHPSGGRVNAHFLLVVCATLRPLATSGSPLCLSQYQVRLLMVQSKMYQLPEVPLLDTTLRPSYDEKFDGDSKSDR